MAKPCEAIRLLSWISDLAHIFSGSALFCSQNSDLNQGIRDRFIGAWRLALLKEEAVAGKVYRADCTALLVYTPDGHMPVGVMYRNQQAGTHAGPVQ